MTEIRATLITPEEFAPYGRLMQVGQMTQGMTTRTIRSGAVGLIQSAKQLESNPAAGRSLDFYDAALTTSPLRVNTAEHPPFSSQISVPMGTTRWLVLVWPDTLNGQSDGLARAFLARPRYDVSYDAGIWHHGIIALKGTGRFASMMGRMPQGGDTVFTDLAEPLAIGRSV